MSRLFEPLKAGRSRLAHRIVMAPLTRFRANDEHVHQSIAEEYYEQRASVPGTLLITEATFITQRAGGMNNVPGIWSKEQIAAWKRITKRVHDKGSFIFLQLWALGRAAYPKVLDGFGADYVSSSASELAGKGKTPRELSEEEIKQYIADYVQAAKNAVEAGFDGVELHGANGYLIDQFTQDVVNKRTDGWGGSIEKRARFGIEVATAVVNAIGADRTAIRLSPWSTFQGMRMEDPVPQFSYLIESLKKLQLAYLHIVVIDSGTYKVLNTSDHADFILDIWGNTSPVILAGGYDAQSARDAVDKQYKDRPVAIAFGRSFISNPDLPFRIQKNIPLTKFVRETFYTPQAAEGYTDYSFSDEFLSESKL